MSKRLRLFLLLTASSGLVVFALARVLDLPGNEGALEPPFGREVDPPVVDLSEREQESGAQGEEGERTGVTDAEALEDIQPDAGDRNPKSSSTLLELVRQFEQKYAGVGRQEQKAAEKSIRDTLDRERLRLAKGRLALGFYDAIPFEYTDSGEVINLLETDTFHRRYEPTFPELATVSIFSDPDKMEWRVVALPASEFPLIHSMQYEKFWLVMFRIDSMRYDEERAFKQVRKYFFPGGE